MYWNRFQWTAGVASAVCMGVICMGVICMGVICMGVVYMGVICMGVICMGVVYMGVICMGVICMGVICMGVVCMGVICCHFRETWCSTICVLFRVIRAPASHSIWLQRSPFYRNCPSFKAFGYMYTRLALDFNCPSSRCCIVFLKLHSVAHRSGHSVVLLVRRSRE